MAERDYKEEGKYAEVRRIYQGRMLHHRGFNV
jgi:hypothetical protein